MPARLDNMPKVFRRISCVDCQEEFQSTGPAAKRCEPCRAVHKNTYERERDRAGRSRRSCCMDCSAPFPHDVHGRVKRCAPCAAIAARAQQAEFQKENKDLARAASRRHYEGNRERILEQRKSPEYRTANAARIKARRDRSPGYRLHCNVSRLLALSLNGDKGGRRWELLLGFTRQQLIVHLERQFTKGMTWENMGGKTGWHIDHILPRSSFSFSSADDPEFKACWALTNLQPLWRAENIAKSDKRLHLI